MQAIECIHTAEKDLDIMNSSGLPKKYLLDYMAAAQTMYV